MKIDPASGPGRFLVDLSKYGGIRYEPYPFQAEFHGSARHMVFLVGQPDRVRLLDHYLNCLSRLMSFEH